MKKLFSILTILTLSALLGCNSSYSSQPYYPAYYNPPKDIFDTIEPAYYNPPLDDDAYREWQLDDIRMILYDIRDTQDAIRDTQYDYPACWNWNGNYYENKR